MFENRLEGDRDCECLAANSSECTWTGRLLPNAVRAVRQVKPENFLLTDPVPDLTDANVKLVDFGRAKVVRSPPTLGMRRTNNRDRSSGV